ncbi:amphi-Trp domain-containing protein [Halosimplex salinum]|uniref:amphi-Trp domain-containing protein n=1 Tax=Halosimplex salinum TaxID=1710538 RepID=UPI000F49BFCF|nr:amphi-Trp domain-containing protein [Halosimplex salinum]
MSDADAPSTEDESTDPEDDTTDHEDERTTIRNGRAYEEEYRLDAAEAGRFLVDLGEQLQAGDELTISTDEWELPFAFGEPVGLEVDFDGVGEPELEIELELPGRTDEAAPRVE